MQQSICNKIWGMNSWNALDYCLIYMYASEVFIKTKREITQVHVDITYQNACSLLVWFLLLNIINIINKSEKVRNLGKNHLLRLVNWIMVFTQRTKNIENSHKQMLQYLIPQSTSWPPMLMRWLHLVDCRVLWDRHRFLLANQVLQRTNKNRSCLFCRITCLIE